MNDAQRPGENERLLDHLEDMAALCLVPTSVETDLQGVIIHHKYKVSFYDALISSALLPRVSDGRFHPLPNLRLASDR
jgi:predicted nucleic acid-binding protein